MKTNNLNKIGSVALTSISIIGLIATFISVPDPKTKFWLFILSGSVLILCSIWLLNTFFEFSKARRILLGSKTIGLINIKKNRLNGTNEIKKNLSKSNEVRLYAVSGQQVIQDYGEEIRNALSENNAKIRIIFAMHGGNIFDEDVEKLKGNLTNTPTYFDIVSSCVRLKKYQNEANASALTKANIPGQIEIAFFDTHNRIPTLICDDSYAAFHISLPPKESNESVFFEVIGNKQSKLYTEDKFIFDLIKNFELNWKYLKDNMLTGIIDDYKGVLEHFNDINQIANYEFAQKKISSGTKYYFNHKKIERNYYLGKDDQIFNHHFGIGEFDKNLIKKANQNEISKELHKLELAQIETLIKYTGRLTNNHKILDAGCGRGGTSIKIHQKFKSKIVGINISDYQVGFANEVAKKLALKDVEFKVMNYLKLVFPENHFDIVILNEVTQYALNLNILFDGLKKVLKKDGKIVIATWCMAKDYTEENWATKINEHYGLKMHTIDAYINSLEQAGLKVKTNEDYSRDALPYFILRDSWDMKSGVEPYYIEGFNSKKLLYNFIVAEK
jgi:geranyl diphosphate 2-C-methyltransferase